jgi:hypothetical protein
VNVPGRLSLFGDGILYGIPDRRLGATATATAYLNNNVFKINNFVRFRPPGTNAIDCRKNLQGTV